MTQSVNIGDRFAVTEPFEVRNDKGRRLANYLPQFDYGVTVRNIDIANGLITDGKAVKVEGSAGLRSTTTDFTAAEPKMTGAIKTNKKKGK
ncbi:hypothetical protein IZ6_24980 [Terrihabitans soli]|uniref:Uncharacterized protein n=1 Tax=Terrihabitans soli TaxID=708113 RepID=A0A6S6QKD7_9HYPH|nr:hypothetical protein [Terrihabitans soli]BCJ91763.1 hypothetical protein IZ6_24980 [Terrihabitans soli]